jgi:hypothetical protein
MKLDLARIVRIDAFSEATPIDRPAFSERPEQVHIHRWPSGIEAVQERSGGFYGSTLIGGKQKIGKSTVEIRSSLESALTGWTVVYCDGENDWDEIERRAWNVLGPGGFDRLPLWHPIIFGRAVTLQLLADQIAMEIDREDERVLICIDSLNRLTKRMVSVDNAPRRYRGGGGYFRALEDVCEWAQACTKLSEGQIGVMMTTEQNRAGTIVGMDAEYSCQVVLYLRPGSDEHAVEFEMLSRRTPGGKLGDHERIFTRCEFVPLAEKRPDPDFDDDEPPDWRKGMQ